MILHFILDSCPVLERCSLFLLLYIVVVCYSNIPKSDNWMLAEMYVFERYCVAAVVLKVVVTGTTPWF